MGAIHGPRGAIHDRATACPSGRRWSPGCSGGTLPHDEFIHRGSGPARGRCVRTVGPDQCFRIDCSKRRQTADRSATPNPSRTCNAVNAFAVTDLTGGSPRRSRHEPERVDAPPTSTTPVVRRTLRSKESGDGSRSAPVPTHCDTNRFVPPYSVTGRSSPSRRRSTGARPCRLSSALKATMSFSRTVSRARS